MSCLCLVPRSRVSHFCFPKFIKKTTVSAEQMLAPFPDPLHPPDAFGQVEVGLYRAASISGISPANLPFLKQLNLRMIVNMGGFAAVAASGGGGKVLGTFCDTQGIKLEQASSLHTDLGEELVKWGLELLLDVKNYPVMMVDGAPDFLAGRIIGCLRRLQGWPMTAILEEYWAYRCCSCSYDENVWFIESFDRGLVRFSEDSLPPGLAVHVLAEEEEEEEEEGGKHMLDREDTMELVSKDIPYNEKLWLLDVDDD